MILTCPNCATRYQADAAKFPLAGRNVRCAKCGHVWHQEAPPAPEPDPAAFDPAGEESVSPEPAVAAPPPPEPEPVPAAPSRIQAYAPNANPVIAREQPAIEAKPRAPSQWPARLGLGAGWLGLAAAVLLIGWAGLHFRHQIVSVWPQSASLYAAMGMKPKPTGLDIQDVAYHESGEGGQTVLSVTGRLANTSSRELPVPQIRVAVLDADNRELYHWSFVPGVMTLHPGQAHNFSTRLSNPPEGARHFQLRFARDGE